MVDGKLITLTRVAYLPSAQSDSYPLSQLPFYFPVSPQDEWSRKIGSTHSEKQVIRRGTVSQFGGPDLEEYSWKSEFLVHDFFKSDSITDDRFMPSYVIPPPAGMRHLSAEDSYALLREILKNGAPVQLTIQDRATGKVEVDMPVTIREFEMSEKGGEPDTRFYSITLREFRFLTIRTVPRAGAVTEGSPGRPGSGRYISSPYTVVAGDAAVTYHSKRYMPIQALSLKAFHDKSKWPQIVSANGGSKGMYAKGCSFIASVKDGPWIIPIGARVVIPEMQGSGVGFVPPGTPAPRWG